MYPASHDEGHRDRSRARDCWRDSRCPGSPYPDQESFLQETRKHLQTDSTLQSSYVYVETRREMKLDKRGRTSEESVRVFESYPGLPGEARWERLIAENGRPVPAEALAKQEYENARREPRGW